MSDPEFIALNVAVLTVSDTRTPETDRSGAIIVDRLEAMGHRVADRRIVTDDLQLVRSAVAAWIAADGVDAVITTGGTGLTRRDVTPDAVAPLGTKHIPGFGELFRWLSFRDIGTSTIQSRADAWLCETTFVFVLPGSTGAVKLAMDEILHQQLDVRHKPCNFVQLLPRIKAG
ncbi:MAG: molybdenum cofactor biosynthesis protein B [Myxococcales bacterium]|nr:molybdenum cofactor biosynthesis protein B [Myxococcales bacterium]